MNKNLFKLFYLSCIWLAVTACGQDESENEIRIPATRTVLVYMAADNSLSQNSASPFPQWDLDEMKQGLAHMTTNDIHLLVYIDTYSDSSARLIELKKYPDGVREEVVREYGERNSVGLSETQEVFNDVFQNPAYQAPSYGLVYWSHADGWIPYQLPDTRWAGQDTGNGGNHGMDIDDLSAVLSQAPHFDFILFDACFMSSIEVAYALRKYTDYYIACPTENPGPGAPYDLLVPLMGKDQPAVQMSQTYFEAYASLYNEGIGISNDHWTGGTSICAIRTDMLGQLAATTRDLLPDSSFDTYVLRRTVLDYDHRYGNSHIGYYDFCEMMQELLNDQDYHTWSEAFYATIAYWNTTAKNYSQFVNMFSMEGTNGISHFIPESYQSSQTSAYRDTPWYQDAGLYKLGW